MGHRVLEGEQTLLRIFLGESDQWHGRPLQLALLERLRKEGGAGVTVLRGIAGFGARSVVHTTHILRLSEDLPIVLELVDTPEQVERLLPILDEMVNEGLVTMEKVRVVKYAPGTPLTPRLSERGRRTSSSVLRTPQSRGIPTASQAKAMTPGL